VFRSFETALSIYFWGFTCLCVFRGARGSIVG
jgi:hypothetical protein